MNRFLYILFILLLPLTDLKAQDPQISQYYAMPVYLGPSFAGGTAGSRISLLARDQWPAIPGAFMTYLGAYDHYFPRTKCGVGLLVMRDQAGSGKLSSTNFGLQYAYNITINRKWEFRPGIQMTYGNRSINYYSMIYGDQLSLEDGTQSLTTEIFPEQNSVGFVDFAASALMYSDLYWGGITFDHMARPNESLTGQKSRIPYTYKVYGGAKISVNNRLNKFNEESVTFTALYKAQGKYDQLDVGVYWLKMPLVIGLWYRGIPLLKSYEPGYSNNDAAIIMVGYHWMNMRVGYSYDFTISRLVTSTGGSHEVSLAYEFLQDQKTKRSKKKVVISCPKF